MPSKQNIIRSTFCSILFIAVTSSAPVNIEELIFDPISYLDAYPEDDYVNSVSGYEYTDGKTKRQTTNMIKYDGEELLSVPRRQLTSQMLKELLQMLKTPKKSGILTLNGWSASGMPFNVLYTPNTLQQKFLAEVNAMADKKPPIPMPQPLRRQNHIAERKEDKEYARAFRAKTSTKQPQMRRHYLVIPQLFVSYGWGSVGK